MDKMPFYAEFMLFLFKYSSFNEGIFFNGSMLLIPFSYRDKYFSFVSDTNGVKSLT